MECTYCGSDLADYDPVFVEEAAVGDDGTSSGSPRACSATTAV